MIEPWTSIGSPPAMTGGRATGGAGNLTTLIEGSTFCISVSTGNVVPGAPMGLFVRDTRVLSHWVLDIDGEGLEPLTVTSADTFAATFVTRSRPRHGEAESTLMVVRERQVGDGMRERIRLRNLSAEPAALTMSLQVGADFADLFEVKAGQVPTGGRTHGAVVANGLELTDGDDGSKRGVLITVLGTGPGRDARVMGGPPAIQTEPDRMTWRLRIPARSEWSEVIEVAATLAGRRLSPFDHDGLGTGEPTAQRRSREWRAVTPVVRTADPGLANTLSRSLEDLGALRIFDPEHPERAVVAAGAPWFMALFGRDALLTSWMVLPFSTELALGTVQTLAEHQGRRVDPLSEEEPGRILHEVRLGRATSPAEPGPHVYYGSVDATPLFVMLLGELRRWGLAAELVGALMPAADRALEWIQTYGDRDGDGFVEYQRATERGLLNQGWKDSVDSITFADGQLAETPIALAEVQAYVYGAYHARAHLAREDGDTALMHHWARKAAELKTAFNAQFWLPQRGWFAMGLDRDKRPIDALASNMGHCLWTGIVDDEKAAAVANHLLSPDLFSGWGVRTLARSMSAYNPISYHNGSVWPHDNALIAAGLARYGFISEAQIVAQGILAAAERFGGRLPELFCGFDRSEFSEPVPYPTSCSPQAWAAASPVMLLRALLRFDPSIPDGEVHLAPMIPTAYLPLHLDRVPIAGRRASVDVTLDGCLTEGFGPGLRVIPEPRSAHTALLP